MKTAKTVKLGAALILVISMAVCMLVCTGCSGKSAIVGQWTAEGGSGPYDFPDHMELYSDGTFDVDGMAGQYSVENGRLKFSFMGFAYVFEYKLNGGVLTLSNKNDSERYYKSEAEAMRHSDDAELTESYAANVPEPEPTISPAEQKAMDITEETTQIKSSLQGIDDPEDALEYLIEQMDLMEATYGRDGIEELSQLQDGYVDAYR